MVPGLLTDGATASRVKIRLKGDFLDHLKGDIWSLRINSKKPFFGMRRFSLQHPKTRAYAFGPLFFEHLQAEGVLSRRTKFVRVTLNGTDWGVMNLEEHPSADLLESAGRKDGVIGRLGSDAQFEHFGLNHRNTSFTPVQYGPFNNYWTAAFRPHREKKLLEKPATSTSLNLARALIASYQNGNLAPSELFDLPSFAKYLVVSTLWGSSHAQYFDNVRLYFNPFTLKFEPVAGENESLRSLGRFTFHTRMLVAGFMDDPKFRDALSVAIKNVTNGILKGPVFDTLTKRLGEFESVLKTDNPFLLKADLSVLRRNAKLLARYGAAFFPSQGVTHPERPKFDETYARHLRLRLYRGAPPRAEIANRLHQPIRVTQLTAKCAKITPPIKQTPKQTVKMDEQDLKARSAYPPQSPKSPQSQKPPEVKTTTWPVDHLIDATPLGGRASKIQIDLALQFGRQNCAIEAKSVRPGTSETRTASAKVWLDKVVRHPLTDQVSSGQKIEGAPWLVWNAKAKQYEAAAGEWTLNTPIMLPGGARLKIFPGTHIIFGPDAFLLIKGAVDFAGTKDKPVILKAKDKTKGWKGIYVLEAKQRSNLRWVQILDTAALENGQLHLTGAVTFYRSDVKMENVAFVGTSAEDALNIFRADFDISGLRIEKTRSDGFDCDFCTGVLRQARFSDIGGDGFDVSGTRARVEDVVAENIRDKAFSIGEASDVQIEKIRTLSVGTGVAVKDGSRARITQAHFERTGVVGLAAYVKKPAYGSAVIEATKITFTGTAKASVLVQTGSRVTLDGKRQVETDIDVDKWYAEGPMRK